VYEPRIVRWCLLRQVALVLIAVAGLLVVVSTGSTQGITRVDVGGQPEEWLADFPRVVIPVTVIDTNGLPVPDLQAEHFSVSEDGNPVRLNQVVSEVDEGAEVYIVLAIDISGSMAAGGALEQAKEAAAVLVDSLGPNDKMAIIAFGDAVNITPPGSPQPIDPTRERNFSNNRQDLLTLIRSLNTVPGQVTTPLWDAALKSALLAQRAPTERRAVILLTDGKEGDQEGKPVSRYAKEDAIIEAIKAHVPVFTIGLGPHVDESYLRSLAERTGGSYTFTNNPPELKDIYVNLLKRLKKRYVLHYRSTLRADGKEHEITVSVSTPMGNASKVTRVKLVLPIAIARFNYLRPSEVKGKGLVSEVLEDGQVIKGNLVIEPVIDAQNGVGRVEYYVNDVLYDTVSEPPYRLYIPSSSFTHTTSLVIRARAYDRLDEGLWDEEVIKVTVEPSPEPPSLPGWVFALAAVLTGIGIGGIVYAVRRAQIQDQQLAEVAPVYGGAGAGAMVSEQTTDWDSGIAERERGPSSLGPPGSTPPETAAVEAPASPGLPASPDVTMAVGLTAAGRERPAAWFTGLSGALRGHSYSVTGQDIVIGRSPTADITLDDPTVSRQHARLRWSEGRYRLYDMGSTNGTAVNGRRVQTVVLRDKDRVQFGDVELTFHVAEW